MEEGSILDSPFQSRLFSADLKDPTYIVLTVDTQE